MRISDWSSDVCSSNLFVGNCGAAHRFHIGTGLSGDRSGYSRTRRLILMLLVTVRGSSRCREEECQAGEKAENGLHRLAFSKRSTSSPNFCFCSSASPLAIDSATQHAAWRLRISLSARPRRSEERREGKE